MVEEIKHWINKDWKDELLMNETNMLGTLASRLGKYKSAAIVAPIFTTLEVVLEVMIPFVTASIIDKGIEAGNINEVYHYGAMMLVMAFFCLVFGVLAGRYSSKAAAGFAANLREGMFENIQTFSFSNIDKYSTAGLVTRMTTDVTNLQNAFQMILRIEVRSPLMLIASMAMCFIINADMSMIFLIAMVILSLGLAAIMIKTTGIFKQVFAKYDDLNASIQENVSAIRVVKAFVREAFENEKFKKAADRLYELYVKAEGRLAFNNPLMMLVVYGCIISISWFGAHYIVGGTMTTGELSSMFSYIMGVLMSLMMLSMVFVMITMSAASAQRIVEVLNEVPDLKEPETAAMEICDGSIDFDHVSFSYKSGSGEDALSDIDLHIRSGETVGIIGGTGSGKSSLVSLISRLYDVSSGSVRVGGIDVRDHDTETLRNEVAVVLQKNVLFSGTILENLRWGKEDATLEECKAACKNACADEFIERFPDGYDTYIERGGTNVSGGQKQRLCIARALLKKPKILILDDSTSAVDTATDAKIREAFAKKIPGTTKLIISQRISSVKDADRIMVLDEGRISGFDTHEALYEDNDIYRDICDAQTQGGGDFDESMNA